MIDFPGRLAVFFFTSGCNFRCGFCHNATLLGKSMPGLSWERLAEACKKYREQWVDGAVISGGEPTLHRELPELITFFRRHGMKVKLDTNGSDPEMLKTCLPLLDYVAMDIKTAPSKYYALTGYDDIEKIRASIELIKQDAISGEFRTTVIERLHTIEDMKEIAELIKGAKRYVLQPFVPQDNLPDPELRKLPRTSPQCMRAMAGPFKDIVQDLIVRGG